MAIYKSSIVDAISGKVSGMEFAVTKTGLVIKRQKRNRNLKSPRWYHAQNVLAHHNQAWNEMTKGTRMTWQMMAPTISASDRFGQQSQLTARALWNTQLMDYGPNPLEPHHDTVPIFKMWPPQSMALSFAEGGPYTIDVTYKWFVYPWWIITVYVARFQAKNTTHKPQTWNRVGPYLILPYVTNWYPRFLFHDVQLVQGEHIAIRIKIQGFYSWNPDELIGWSTVT